MADYFPTALQRTSDERWVTLEVVAREPGRLVARLLEAPDHAAVIRWSGDAAYDQHLRSLLAAPPPTPGEGVHLSWPDDLLHDLDARVVGYLTPRVRARQTFALADYVDPAQRAQIAPMATRRHHLRVARNTATAIAAIHHAGHARIRARQFRLDDRAHVVVVRTDEILPDAPRMVRTDDERRLTGLIGRLIGGSPWMAGTGIAPLLARTPESGRGPAPASEWFHVLREAERSIPAERLAIAPRRIAEKRMATSTDLAEAQAEGGMSPRRAVAPGAPIVIRVPDRDAEPAGGRPSMDRPIPLPTGTSARATEVSAWAADRFAARTGRTAPTAQVTADVDTVREPVYSTRTMTVTRREPDSAKAAVRIPRSNGEARPEGEGAPPRRSAGPRPSNGTTPAASTSRGAFVLASGLVLGAVASVAPFAAFIAGATAVFTRAAVKTGKRKSTLGPHQTVTNAVSRFIPFATGGLALAAFVLFDLLLVLGLVMALAARLFDYGPGFTLNFIFDLPEVPLLVRWFAFAVGGAAGLSLGGGVHDSLRERVGTGRMIATPAFAIAVVFSLLVMDAGILWWPLPATG